MIAWFVAVGAYGWSLIVVIFGKSSGFTLVFFPSTHTSISFPKIVRRYQYISRTFVIVLSIFIWRDLRRFFNCASNIASSVAVFAPVTCPR